MSEILALEVDRNIKEIFKDTTDELIEALDGGKNRMVQSIMERIRKLFSKIDTELQDANPMPIEPDLLTSGLIKSFEKAFGSSVEKISSCDRKRREFKYKGEIYEDSPNAFFTRLGRSIFGTVVEYGFNSKKYLISRREGLDHESAKSLVLKEKEIMALPEPSLITSEHIDKFEKASGAVVEKMDSNDVKKHRFQIGDDTYEDSVKSLFWRTSKAVYGIGTEFGKTKRILVLIRDGNTYEKSVKIVEKQEIQAGQRLPKPPNLNQEHLKALERRIGKNIEDMDVEDRTYFAFSIGSEKYQDNLCALMQRVGMHLFNSKFKYAKIRRYLSLIRSGHSHDKALKEVNCESAFNSIPNPPLLNKKHLLKFEAAVGIKLEDMKYSDQNRYIFKIAGVEYSESPMAIFSRMTRQLFEDETNWTKARQYLILVRNGKDHVSAIQIINDGKEGIEEDEFEKITTLKLEEAMALLQDDPIKLKRYLQFAHPELSHADIDKLVTRSFKGLRGGEIESNESKYLEWTDVLAVPALDEDLATDTDKNSITLTGVATACSHVFIAGAYTRRKRVEADGTFSITIPLKTGKQNEIRLMSLNTEKELRSEQVTSHINQIGDPDDIAALVRLLSELGTSINKDIQQDPGRLHYLRQCMEQSLIKKFGLRFSDGEEYMEELIEKPTTSSTMRGILKFVLKKFQRIHEMEFDGVVEGNHLFFQKYCIAEIRRRIEEKLPGVILANDPGTGKTRIVQGATADRHTTVITPNSVVAAWEEEAGKVLKTANITALHNEHSSIRKQRLQIVQAARNLLELPQHVYTNREFLRDTSDNERFKLLSNKDTIVVEDEAHSRHSEQSEQTKGAKKLDAAFRILVTATPAKNSRTFRRMMAVLKPDDQRFKSDAAFAKAFPDNDPQALKTLSLMKDEFTIRFRKEDVMETVDSKQSLAQQKHKLPMKKFENADEGAFTMSMDQAESIYLMFTNWEKWCRKNNRYIPDTEVVHEDRLRTSNGFAKKHAMRQIINNPKFINSSAPDAKLKKMRQKVNAFLQEGRKVVIFCAYEAQTQKYAEAFADLNPAVYTGQTSKMPDCKYKKGGTEGSSNDWILDENNYPIPDEDGGPMSALEYERVTFQNTNNRRLLIATYDAGAVGTTFTAGKATIFDDSADDCIEEIQAEDRIHRIDPDRMTHADVKYSKLQSRYPDRFIKAMKKKWLVREGENYKEFDSQEAAQRFANRHDTEAVNAYAHFFAQGTYDQVQAANLRVQRVRFHLINDGIEDESTLKDGNRNFVGI